MECDGQGRWTPGRHHELIARKLEAVERGEIKRLMILLPPGHGKSEQVSRKFPAWYLGRNPEKHIILTSYGSELPHEFSEVARDTFATWGPILWGLELSRTQATKSNWRVRGHRGGMVAAGIGGPVTGRRAHLLIIDDPIKNHLEANSRAHRNSDWEWYRTVARTRLMPGAAIILVMTRWHEDDMAGRLLKEAAAGGETWEVIRLPALAEEDDLLGRAKDEPLWPEFGFDLKWAENEKVTQGSYNWSALYQQTRPECSR